MKHITFTTVCTYHTALLIKDLAFNKVELEKYYNPDLNMIAFDLAYGGVKKPKADFMKEYLNQLLKGLNQLGTKLLLCADNEYFKKLTKTVKTGAYYGEILPCAIKGYEHISVLLSVNYKIIKYNPNMIIKLNHSLEVAKQFKKGAYIKLGSNIIHSEYYPDNIEDIKKALQSLHAYEVLTVDIEAFSLDFHKADIATISFAWNQHEGLAFKVAYEASKSFCDEVKSMLKEFFINYEGKLIGHNLSYDLKILIYELFMEDIEDIVGMLQGIEVMAINIGDTKLISYLATNNAIKNSLSLKDLAQEFAGSYAVDIKNIREIPLNQVLTYNLIDCLSTWFVFNKYYPILIKDQQVTIYNEVLLPSIKTLLQTELTGMCLDMNQVNKADEELNKILERNQLILSSSSVVIEFEDLLREHIREVANGKLKKKVKPLNDFIDVEFNPNSGLQVASLLHDFIGLDIIDLTDTGLPATSADTLIKHLNTNLTPEIKEIVSALVEIIKVEKILNSFIKVFKKRAILHPNGEYYIHGNYNIGGTVSGRLSSSKINMQQIPSHSTYSKIIKKCFKTPPNTVFVGSDYAQLESRVDTLLTKDPMKEKVYIEGFDSHCLASYYYFPEKMQDINPEDKISIKSIKDKYPELRQDSKGITFAALYGGTYRTFMDEGFTEEEAKKIEANYNKMYQVSIKWKQEKINQAKLVGYVVGAFGLRLRTPLIDKNNYIAESESRTAGNMIGQSWCLLTLRAMNEFMSLVHQSKWKYHILPCATIHDAIYLYIHDSLECVEWVNNNLIKIMGWDKLPEIYHPQIPLESELDIFKDNWSNPITIKNKASIEEIWSLCNKGK